MPRPTQSRLSHHCSNCGALLAVQSPRGLAFRRGGASLLIERGAADTRLSIACYSPRCRAINPIVLPRAA